MPELPADFELPKLRDKRLDNLTYHEGRVPGSINRITKDLKTGIINGAVAHGADGKGKDGLDGYLCMCAARFPKHYMQMLAKLLPLQVHGHGDGFTGPGIQTINIVGIPHDHYVSGEEIERMRSPTLRELEPPEPEPPEPEPPEPSPPEPRLAELEKKLLAMDHAQLLELATAFNVDKAAREPELGYAPLPSRSRHRED